MDAESNEHRESAESFRVSLCTVVVDFLKSGAEDWLFLVESGILLWKEGYLLRPEPLRFLSLRAS